MPLQTVASSYELYKRRRQIVPIQKVNSPTGKKELFKDVVLNLSPRVLDCKTSTRAFKRNSGKAAKTEYFAVSVLGSKVSTGTKRNVRLRLSKTIW